MELEEFLHEAVRQGSAKSIERLSFRCEEVFSDISLPGISLLEIGAGPGNFCFWAALHGAREVVALEPEAAGSTSGSSRKFQQMLHLSGLKNVTLFRRTIQQYEPAKARYDVALSYNSIEHLDEEAVQRLQSDPDSREVYQVILRKIAQSLKPGGRFIIYNVGRTNLWPLLGLHNPFAPTIEWHIHQDPSLWRTLLLDSGFDRVDTGWELKYSLRHMGPLVSNCLFTFFTDSMFRLVAWRTRGD